MMTYVRVLILFSFMFALYLALKQQDKPSMSQPTVLQADPIQPTVLQADPILPAEVVPVATPGQKEPVYAVVVTAWNENNSYSWELYFYRSSSPEAAQKAALGEYVSKNSKCRSPMTTVRVVPE